MSYTMADVDRAQLFVKRKTLVRWKGSEKPIGHVVGMYINYHKQLVGVVVESNHKDKLGTERNIPVREVEVVK